MQFERFDSIYNNYTKNITTQKTSDWSNKRINKIIFQFHKKPLGEKKIEVHYVLVVYFFLLLALAMGRLESPVVPAAKLSEGFA